MLSLDYLIERIWESLGLVKVYTKKRGERPDLSDPVCLRKGATIEVCIIILIFPCAWRCKIPRFYDIPQDVCLGIHKSLATNFRYGLVWCVFFSLQYIDVVQQVCDFQGMDSPDVLYLRLTRSLHSLFVTRDGHRNLHRTRRRLV
jgi:hypothetical protein